MEQNPRPSYIYAKMGSLRSSKPPEVLDGIERPFRLRSMFHSR